MADQLITNNELLDYLRHELSDDRRKEIAARMYSDSKLQLRFKEIQRIEALVTENYDFGKVNVSSEVEKNIVRYINETVANIVTEKEQNILSVKKLIEENENHQKEKAQRKYLFNSIGWAAVVVICVGIMFNVIANIAQKNQKLDITATKPIKSATPLNLSEKTSYDSLELEIVASKPVKFDENERFELTPKTSNESVVSSSDNIGNKSVEVNLEKYNNSDVVKNLHSEKQPTMLKVKREEVMRGDLNNDGLINNADLEILNSMLHDDKDVTVNLPADMDKDNKITLKDLVLLAKQVESNPENN